MVFGHEGIRMADLSQGPKGNILFESKPKIIIVFFDCCSSVCYVRCSISIHYLTHNQISRFGLGRDRLLLASGRSPMNFRLLDLSKNRQSSIAGTLLSYRRNLSLPLSCFSCSVLALFHQAKCTLVLPTWVSKVP